MTYDEWRETVEINPKAGVEDAMRVAWRAGARLGAELTHLQRAAPDLYDALLGLVAIVDRTRLTGREESLVARYKAALAIHKAAWDDEHKQARDVWQPLASAPGHKPVLLRKANGNMVVARRTGGSGGNWVACGKVVHDAAGWMPLPGGWA